jgi:hypothetical protein
MREVEPKFSWEEYLNSFYVLPDGRQRLRNAFNNSENTKMIKY